MNLLNILFSGGGEAEEHKENGGGDGGAALHGDHFGKLKDADGHRPALNMGTTSRKGGEDCWGEQGSVTHFWRVRATHPHRLLFGLCCSE